MMKPVPALLGILVDAIDEDWISHRAADWIVAQAIEAGLVDADEHIDSPAWAAAVEHQDEYDPDGEED